MADHTVEQKQALALMAMRARAAEAESAPETPAEAPVRGLSGFESTGGGAAVGNPMLKANLPQSRNQTDIPYDVGGKATELLSGAGLPAEVAASGGVVANMATNALPMLIGGGGGRAAVPLLEAAAKSRMQSALKPILSANERGAGERAVQTMLDEGLNVSKGGVAELHKRISDLHGEVEKIVANSGAKIDISPIADAFKKLKAKAIDQASWETDLKTVKDSFAEFFRNPQMQKLADKLHDLPIDVAQRMKRGTQQSVADSFGTKGTAWEESQKAISDILRRGIEKAEPAVGPANARQSDLLNALEITKRRALMEGNKNPFGLSLVAHHPAAGAAFALDRSAFANSVLANLLYKGRGAAPAIGTGLGAGYSLADMQEQ